MVKRIAILGSTGSIGTQALEVIDQHPAIFKVEVLTAMNQADLLISQAIQYKPSHVVIGDEAKYEFVKILYVLQRAFNSLHYILHFVPLRAYCYDGLKNLRSLKFPRVGAIASLGCLRSV